MEQRKPSSKKKNSFTATVLCEHKISTPPGNFRYHMHNEFEVFFFLRGDVNYIVEQQVYGLEPGDILLFNNTEFHYPTFRTNAEFERIVLHFDPTMAQQFSTLRTPLLRRFLSRPQGEQNLVRLAFCERKRFHALALLIEQESQSTQEGDDVLAAAHLSELLVLLARAPQTQPPAGRLSPYVSQALAYINTTLPQAISLAEIACALSVDRFHLDKTFKKETGTTVCHYVLLKRLNLARVLLAQGWRVNEACAGAGFNDYSNFIRTFKKHTGMTPAAFARANQSSCGDS